ALTRISAVGNLHDPPGAVAPDRSVRFETMLRSLFFAVLLLYPSAAFGQIARVGVNEENFRAAPGGAVLATVLRGAELRLGRAQGDWREATIEGWSWSSSVEAQQRDGYDHDVIARGGETRRDTTVGVRFALLKQVVDSG